MLAAGAGSGRRQEMRAKGTCNSVVVAWSEAKREDGACGLRARDRGWFREEAHQHEERGVGGGKVLRMLRVVKVGVVKKARCRLTQSPPSSCPPR